MFDLLYIYIFIEQYITISPYNVCAVFQAFVFMLPVGPMKNAALKAVKYWQIFKVRLRGLIRSRKWVVAAAWNMALFGNNMLNNGMTQIQGLTLFSWWHTEAWRAGGGWGSLLHPKCHGTCLGGEKTPGCHGRDSQDCQTSNCERWAGLKIAYPEIIQNPMVHYFPYWDRSSPWRSNQICRQTQMVKNQLQWPAGWRKLMDP